MRCIKKKTKALCFSCLSNLITITLASGLEFSELIWCGSYCTLHQIQLTHVRFVFSLRGLKSSLLLCSHGEYRPIQLTHTLSRSVTRFPALLHLPSTFLLSVFSFWGTGELCSFYEWTFSLFYEWGALAHFPHRSMTWMYEWSRR